MAVIILETPRILLRPVIPSDLDDIYEYSCQPEVGPNAGWEPHKSKDETRAIMQMLFVGKEGMFGIELKNEHKLIGNVGLAADPKRENLSSRMLGYAIGKSYWGHGYMTEAALRLLEYGFTKLELNIISAYCYPQNDRSRNVIKKCGMTFEGRQRQAETVYSGEVYDNECWSVTREEFLNRKL